MHSVAKTRIQGINNGNLKQNTTHVTTGKNTMKTFSSTNNCVLTLVVFLQTEQTTQIKYECVERTCRERWQLLGLVGSHTQVSESETNEMCFVFQQYVSHQGLQSSLSFENTFSSDLFFFFFLLSNHLHIFLHHGVDRRLVTRCSGCLFHFVVLLVGWGRAGTLNTVRATTCIASAITRQQAELQVQCAQRVFACPDVKRI